MTDAEQLVTTGVNAAGNPLVGREVVADQLPPAPLSEKVVLHAAIGQRHLGAVEAGTLLGCYD